MNFEIPHNSIANNMILVLHSLHIFAFEIPHNLIANNMILVLHSLHIFAFPVIPDGHFVIIMNLKKALCRRIA